MSEISPNKVPILVNLGAKMPFPLETWPSITAAFLHFGEELFLVPSFIVNLAGCNLACPCCSEREQWKKPKQIRLSPERLAESFVQAFESRTWPKTFQWIGGEPTRFLPYILSVSKRLKAASAKPLPIYLNSNAYFEPSLFEDMAGLIDGFVLDLKATEACVDLVGGVRDYWKVVSENARLAIGRFQPSSLDIVRHLVMPGHVDCCTLPILNWIKATLPPETAVNLMTTFQNFSGQARYPKALLESDAERALVHARSLNFRQLLINGLPDGKVLHD